MNHLPRNIIRVLECLVECETLRVCSLRVCSLMDFIKGLPDSQISLAAKALKCNPTLSKLILLRPSSAILPTALFPSLEVNTILQKVWLKGHFCIDAECGQAIGVGSEKTFIFAEFTYRTIRDHYASTEEWPDALGNNALQRFLLWVGSYP
ncbi:hypothetical protein MTO96_030246 [Rhipicephalus appendiculatus]